MPPGKFRVGHVRFRGQCSNNDISFHIQGTILPPSDDDFRSISDEYWLLFELADGVTIHGGVLDARGGRLWDCKRSGGVCPNGATVSFD